MLDFIDKKPEWKCWVVSNDKWIIKRSDSLGTIQNEFTWLNFPLDQCLIVLVIHFAKLK